MKEYHFPTCKQQKQFEDLAAELIKVISQFDTDEQNAVFEYAQTILLNKRKKERNY